MSDWPTLYADYLRSQEWAERRAKVMERAGHRCEGCRAQPATEVHHLTYQHATQEFLFELVAICGDCHARWHGKPERPKAPTWTPRHIGRGQAKESPNAQARRGQLSQLAAKHREKTMAEPIVETPSTQALLLRSLAQQHREQGRAEYADQLEREADALAPPRDAGDVPEARYGDVR